MKTNPVTSPTTFFSPLSTWRIWATDAPRRKVVRETIVPETWMAESTKIRFKPEQVRIGTQAFFRARDTAHGAGEGPAP